MKLIIYAKINISIYGVLFSKLLLYALSEWYRLCPLVPSQVHMLKPSPQSASIWMWDLGDDQVTRPCEWDGGLWKKDPRLSSSLCQVRTQQKAATYEPGVRKSPDTKSSGAWLLDFPASRTSRNRCLLFVNHQVYDTLWQQSEWTKAVGHL